MSDYNKKREAQLGMSLGAARNKLHKSILFKLICEAELNECYQCGDFINNVDNLSIEHKEPWLYSNNPVDLYFDLTNIAFSHLKCNSGAARRNKTSCGSLTRYINHGCRCDECTKSKSDYSKKIYSSEKRSDRYKRLGT